MSVVSVVRCQVEVSVRGVLTVVAALNNPPTHTHTHTHTHTQCNILPVVFLLAMNENRDKG